MKQNPLQRQVRYFRTHLDEPGWLEEMQRRYQPEYLETNLVEQEIMSNDESENNSDEEAVYQQMGLLKLKDIKRTK